MNAAEKAVDAGLAEFDSLRDELFARLESQRQSFNYLVTLSAAVLALAAAALGPGGSGFDARLVMFAPLIAAPLAFIFFDNEIVIWSIGRYIRDELGPRLSELIGKQVLELEASRGHVLTGGLGVLHLALSIGRWLLFLLAIGLPLWYGFDIRAYEGWRYVPPFWVIVLLDAVVLTLLLVAMSVSIVMRLRGWRDDRRPVSRKGQSSPPEAPPIA